MQWRKQRAIQVLTIIGLLPVLLYLASWGLYLLQIPPGWKLFVNWKTHRYIFAHPPEWVVSDCGDAAVVAAKTSVEHCYLPIEAPEMYLDNLYFQVFPPGGLKGSVYTGIDVPQKLENWTSVTWIDNEDRLIIGSPHRRYWGVSIPIGSVAQLSNATNSKDIEIISSKWFEIGFISDPAHEEVMEKVVRTFHFF